MIEKLENDLLVCKKKLKSSDTKFKMPHKFITSAHINSKGVNATHGRRHENLAKSKIDVLSYVSSIPTFNDSNVEWLSSNINIGDGQFGEVKLAKIKTLNLVVAAKMHKSHASKNSILSETVISITLSGHVNFPFCFGLLGDNVTLMEYFGSFINDKWDTCPNFAQRLQKDISVKELTWICVGIIDAFQYLHKKLILHNDIKADNIIIADHVKIIDFGKSNLVKSPLVYNIMSGSAESHTYNKHHQHLAYELRNCPGTKQSIYTDIYSIGYMFKHAAARIPYEPIIELGRLMKSQDVTLRISLKNAMDKLIKF